MRCLESEAVELKNNVTVFINVYLCYKEEFIIHTARCYVQLFSSLKKQSVNKSDCSKSGKNSRSIIRAS